jgi:Na+-driven multidrug efflux pump
VVPLLFIRDIYYLIGQNEQITDMASQYVWIVMTGVYFHWQTQTTVSFSSA